MSENSSNANGLIKKVFFYIKARDPLFFRASKPFNRGEQVVAESMNLPYPSVIWGALYSKMVRDNGAEFNGEELSHRLRINNIYLHNQKERKSLIAAPLDLFMDEREKRSKADYHDQSSLQIESSSKIPFLSIPNKEGSKTLENKFIEIGSLREAYFKNFPDDINLYDFDEVFLSDYKVGIKRNYDKRAAEEHCLYRINLTQFKDNWGFLIEAEVKSDWIDKIKGGYLKLGGEGKSAYCFVYKEGYKDPLNKIRAYYKNYSCPLYKLILTSPGIFSAGAFPFICKEGDLEENLKKEGILAASLSKALSIGGFDMKKKKQKAMLRAAPAGSVYVINKEVEGFEDFLIEDELCKNNELCYRGFNRAIKIPLYQEQNNKK